ncbi:MAG TPA: Vms1/Ankzf1 family peptidyl-tRNA hydrolase [Terriglobales bacterium]|nr:Vms1/Ankzf1 family peptidyl-tRNA hydrolase [Terriglobales bacterium]
MFSQDQIAQLEGFDARDARVLSVYLDLDPASQVRRSYRVAFDAMVKAARERLDEGARAALAEEAVRVQGLLENETPRGLGLAVFSCAARGLWQTSYFAVRVRNHLAFEARPDLAPLLMLIDAHERYAVALVDKATARLFVIFAGEIEEREEVTHELVRKHEQGGWSQSHFQRHADTHVLWHLKNAVARLTELHRRRRFDRLILAGAEEATSELRRLLPRALAQRVVATLPSQVTANEHELVEKTLVVEREVARDLEERVLVDIQENLNPGGRASLGVMPVLAALWSDVVQTLVVADGLQLEGSECPNCHRLDGGVARTCPTCQQPMRAVDDVVHRAMGRALEQGATVDMLHGDRAQRLMAQGGGLAAMLRYPTAVPESVARQRQARSA